MLFKVKERESRILQVVVGVNNCTPVWGGRGLYYVSESPKIKTHQEKSCYLCGNKPQ